MSDAESWSILPWSAVAEHWYDHNIRPLVVAFISMDPEKIQTALTNFGPLYYKYIVDQVSQSPEHFIVETFLLLFILYILFAKQGKTDAAKNNIELTKKEMQEIVNEWKPEPLVSDKTAEEIEEIKSTLVVSGAATTHVQLEGYKDKKLNFVTFDFLGLANDEDIKNTARDALNKYGCGSCGPRGFYGTIDAHIKIEEDLARFFGCPEAIIYSDAANTPPSTIPAFAKRGDLIVADAAVNETIRTGLMLSRAKIMFYKHNDMADLERVLVSVHAEDTKLGRTSDCQRRFIVSEGLFRNYGTIMDLPTIAKLKAKYFFRLIVDETLSVGVLGKTGKGVTEHFGMPLDAIDVLSGSLSHSFGSIGGFCVGSQEVVDHQRLSGAGYVFSASSPPFTACVASKALEIMQENPGLLEELEVNIKTLVGHLKKIKGLKVTSDIRSPVVHLQIASSSAVDTSDSEEMYTVLDRMSKLILDDDKNGAVVMATKHMPRESASARPPASLRVAVSAVHTKAHLKACSDAIKAAAEQLL